MPVKVCILISQLSENIGLQVIYQNMGLQVLYQNRTEDKRMYKLMSSD